MLLNGNGFRTPHCHEHAVVLDSMSIVNTCDALWLCARSLRRHGWTSCNWQVFFLDSHCRAPEANGASNWRVDGDHACVSQAFSAEALAFQDRIAMKSGLEWGKTALPPVCSHLLWTGLTLFLHFCLTCVSGL